MRQTIAAYNAITRHMIYHLCVDLEREVNPVMGYCSPVLQVKHRILLSITFNAGAVRKLDVFQ